LREASYFKTRDNLRLYYERHVPKKSRAVLVFHHGLNEHSGRYAHVVERFGADFSVYVFDSRGHGRSDGLRSYASSIGDFTADLDEFLKLIRGENPDADIFLVGHSMGGQIALNYLADYPRHPLSGVVTSSANVRIGWNVNPIKRAVGFKLAKYWPRFRFPGEVDPKWISHDPAVVEAYRNDPLVPQYVTAAIAAAVLENQTALIGKAQRIKMPALLMHAGDDRISSPKGTADFFAKMASKDKTLKIYEGLYHELFNELEKERVFDDVEAWLKKRI
jgi:lysophospholipase